MDGKLLTFIYHNYHFYYLVSNNFHFGNINITDHYHFCICLFLLDHLLLQYPEFEGRDISGFYIQIIDDDQNIKKNEIRVNGYEVRQFMIQDLDERTKYAVSVAAFSQEGKGPYSGEKLVITGYG